ncbi:MAG: 4Fe-4S dicluster domain-containing protein [Desulfobacterales bacterium]|nr:4Fe-4S dicluster domain-containing protein [Desulfobacterales bacterium]
MSANISRRAFIKGGIATCAVAASGIPASAAGADKDKQLATLLDIGKCIGCGACVEACSEVNAGKYPEPKKPFPKMYPDRAKPEDWSDKKDVNDRLTPYNWLYIQGADVTVNGEQKTITIPRRCMHCTNPPCVKLCPWGSAKQLENGISRIDPDICLGGAKCREVCPWEIPQRQTGIGLYLDILPAFAGNGVMYKCDRCYNRIAEGKLPACIEVCPENVQEIGPRDEIIKKAHALAKKTNSYIYGENENGGTNTIYVSPVPFETLNKAIETGKGKPHLRAVSDSMGKANNLVAALAIAPIAGIAAAVGTFYKYSRKEKEEKRDEPKE